MSGAASSSTTPRLQVSPQNSVNQRPTMALLASRFGICASPGLARCHARYFGQRDANSHPISDARRSRSGAPTQMDFLNNARLDARRAKRSQSMPEAILEPELPIIDPHHLWDRTGGRPPVTPDLPANAHSFMRVGARTPRYLLPELLADLRSGHNVIATVFMQCGAMYRADGPEHMKPVGETEFVNGIAAMTASGAYGDVRACAGIVGHADCTIGEQIDEVLEAHLKVSDRFRGIRHSCSADPDPGVLGPLA